MNTAEYKDEVSRELRSILQYWMEYMPDNRPGHTSDAPPGDALNTLPNGFFGRIDENDRPDPDAPKGLVLNSRILWTFSAAYRQTSHAEYLPVADRAYEYLLQFFLDKEYGGAFWSLNAEGQPLDTRKQIYGQAFALYGFSEYYRATGKKEALDEALSLFRLIEKFSFDQKEKGYFEAFARDWSLQNDVRLSEKETNDPKTMNTHLHILEAYTNLYRACPDPLLLSRIFDLLKVFDNHIVGANGHLDLFFNDQWKPRSTIISYGHDIEAAWLLHEAALVIKDNGWIKRTTRLALDIAAAAAEGLDTDGGLWYEQEDGRLIRQKHWWPQAEAMIGFLQTWQLTGEQVWLQRSQNSWDFIKKYIRLPDSKEWFWGVEADHSPMTGQDKAGFWKCPYHNSRACLEIISRLDILP